MARNAGLRLVTTLLPSVIIGAVVACTPLAQPGGGDVATTAYPIAQASEPTLTPGPGYPALPTEVNLQTVTVDTSTRPPKPTDYPTVEWIVTEGEVAILDKTWFVTLPSGWTVTSLPTTADIRNYAEDLGGEFVRGDEHIVIRVTLYEFPKEQSALDVIGDLRDTSVESSLQSDTQPIPVGEIEPFEIAGYSGYVFQDPNDVGAQRAFVFDKSGMGVIIDILPTTSPGLDEAKEVLATLRQE